MKKLLMLSAFAALAFAACKKKEDTVSRLYSVSYPTITIQTPTYYSFPVGGGPLPNANTILASAYDSFYHESIKPVIDASKLSNIAPGLYIATLSARNSHGFTGYAYVYVAITDVLDTINLSGRYLRAANNDTVHITKMARGLYRTDNVGGVKWSEDPEAIVPGHFVQDGDQLTLHMPTQPSAIGPFSGMTGLVNMIPGDTSLQYVLTGNAKFDGATRVFKKL